jgi:hypothetical protein
MSVKGSLTRRHFLKGSTVAASLALTGLSFSTAFGLKTARAAQSDDAQTIVNIAATAEAFACTHYHRALVSPLSQAFNKVQTGYLKAGLDSEFQHLQFLYANGATLLTNEFYFPLGTFDSIESFSAITDIAETVFVAAYLAATNRFAELGQPALAATTAQIAVVEGQHLALVRLMGNQLANSVTMGKALFRHVSDAVPMVASLFDGKEGVLGSMEPTSVRLPSDDAIWGAIGTSQLESVETFVAKTLTD